MIEIFIIICVLAVLLTIGGIALLNCTGARINIENEVIIPVDVQVCVDEPDGSASSDCANDQY